MKSPPIATLALAAALAAIVPCSGCQAMAALWTIWFPKEKVAPEFELPDRKSTKVLVFPDDMFNPLSYPPAKRAVATRINEIIEDKELAGGVVPYDELRDLQSTESDFNRLSVSTVGRKLGADLVVYVLLQPLSLKDTPADTLWHGRFSARVRVVDVNKGRIWPDEAAGREVAVEEDASDNPAESYGAELARRLGNKLADKIAELFHEHYEDRMRPPKERLKILD